MAIGPGIYREKYKDYSVNELERELERLQKYLVSEELKKARQEEIDRRIDDNNCILNVETAINVVKELLDARKLNFTEDKRNNVLLEDIVKKYKENGVNEGFVNLLDSFANEIIKDTKVDPFWSTMAKEILKIFIILNLQEKKQVTLIELVEQSKDINKARQLCKENINKLDITKLQTYGSFANGLTTLNAENNDKTLSSILEIIYNHLVGMNRIPKCHICESNLMHMMPDGKYFYCNKCNKYYLNDNGYVGDETESPYKQNDVLY